MTLRVAFRLKGSAFTAELFVFTTRLNPDRIARDVVALACERLGGVAPNQLELIA